MPNPRIKKLTNKRVKIVDGTEVGNYGVVTGETPYYPNGQMVQVILEGVALPRNVNVDDLMPVRAKNKKPATVKRKKVKRK